MKLKVDGLFVYCWLTECRRGKNIYEKFVIKVPDYTILPVYLGNDLTMKPTFTIEIKPKQGFTHEGDRNVLCTYCLTQFYKVNK